MTEQSLAKSPKIPSLSPSLKIALAGKTERRYGENGTYTVEGPWEPWNASEAAREEAQTWLKSIGDIEAPLGQKTFEDAILELAYATSLPRSGRIDAEIMLKTYRAALADLPGSIVLAGLREAIRVCKWFPSVAELRGLMEPQAKELRLQIERARSLATPGTAKPKLAAPKVKGFGDMTKAEKAAHEHRMEKLRSDMASDTGKDRLPRSNSVRMLDGEREKIFEKWENEARGRVA